MRANMEKNNSSRKTVKQEERDEIIGRALSRVIKECGKADECPSLEDISSLIDGALDEQKRDRLLGHLSQCDKCYEVFSMAKEMAKEEKMPAMKRAAISPIRRWILSPAPIAIAAAVILVIVIKFFLQLTGEYSPLSSSQIMSRLSKSTDIRTLARTIKEGLAPSYGFTVAVPLEKASFRIGVSLIDLEISLAAEDKAKSLDIIKRVNSNLRDIEGSGDLISFYSDISKKLEEGAPPKEFSEKSQKIESFIKNKDTFLYLRFGEWVEGGRLAAFSKNKEFFDSKSLQYFNNNLEGKNLPQGIFTSLNEVKSILGQDTISEKDFKQIDVAFSTIIEIM